MSDNKRLNTPLPIQVNEEPITAAELKNILDVNHKAISIYIEVEKQNEEIIKSLKDIEDKSKIIAKDIANIKSGKTEISGSMQASLIDSLESSKNIEDNLYRLLEYVEEQNKAIIEFKPMFDRLNREIIDKKFGERLDQIKEIHEKVTEIHSTTESVNFIEIHQNTKATKDDVFKLTVAFGSGVLITIIGVLVKLLIGL